MILPRSFFDSLSWRQKRVYSEAEAWLDIVRSARYKSEPCTAVVNAKCVTWSRGEWPVSLRFLANRWQWGIGLVRSFLTRLCKNGQVCLEKSSVNTIIKVVDYDKYCGASNKPMSTPSSTPMSTPSGTPSGTLSDYSNQLTDNTFANLENGSKTQAPAHSQHTTNTGSSTNTNKDIKDINNIFINDNNARARKKNSNENGCQEKSIHDEIREMSANESWMEAICMRHHIAPQQLAQYLDAFAAECVCCGRNSHQNMADALSHFNHWLRIQLQQNNTPTHTSKSNHHAYKRSRPTSNDFIKEAQQWAISQSMDLIHKAALRCGGT